MEQVVRTAVDGARVVIEMRQTFRALDAHDGRALTEVEDIYLIRECERRRLLRGETIDDLLHKVYVLAKEETDKKRVWRFIMDRLIGVAYSADGGRARAQGILGLSKNTMMRGLKALNEAQEIGG